MVDTGRNPQRVGGKSGTGSLWHRWCQTLSPCPGGWEEQSLPPPAHLVPQKSRTGPPGRPKCRGEGARGHGGGRGSRRGLEASGNLLRTRAPCRGKGVKCAGADAGWKRDFTSPMCSLAGSISTHSLFLPLPCRSPARILTRPSLPTITSAVLPSWERWVWRWRPWALAPTLPDSPGGHMPFPPGHTHPIHLMALGCFPGDWALRGCPALRASFPALSPVPSLASALAPPHQAPGHLRAPFLWVPGSLDLGMVGLGQLSLSLPFLPPDRESALLPRSPPPPIQLTPWLSLGRTFSP